MCVGMAVNSLFEEWNASHGQCIGMAWQCLEVLLGHKLPRAFASDVTLFSVSYPF